MRRRVHGNVIRNYRKSVKTIKPFPQDYELITLFESEPIILSEEVPWYYNTLFFELSREEIDLNISIEPACNRLSIRTSNKKQGTIFELEFEPIIGLEIYKDSYSEGLIIIMDEDDPNVTLKLETKPYIRLIGTGDRNFRK